jgi:surface protein
MFSNSPFNRDISKWNTSNVKHMGAMFAGTNFNGDISKWDTSQVKDMRQMFYGSKFNGDLSQWKPLDLIEVEDAFLDCPAPMPYWAQFANKEERNKAIDSYWMKKELKAELDKDLVSNDNKEKKIKI